METSTSTDFQDIKPSTQSSKEEFDLQDFQAKLDVSLVNVFRMVDSWIPIDLQNKLSSRSSSSSTSKPINASHQFHSSRSTQPRLGLGAKPNEQASRSSSTLKLRSQLSKPSKKPSTEDQITQHQTLEDQEAEESRTRTFKTKTLPKDRFQVRKSQSNVQLQPPSQVSNNISSRAPPQLVSLYGQGPLSKRQLKKQRKLERLRLAAASLEEATGCSRPNQPTEDTPSLDQQASSRASSSAVLTPLSASIPTTPENASQPTSPQPKPLLDGMSTHPQPAPSPSSKRNKKRKRKPSLACPLEAEKS